MLCPKPCKCCRAPPVPDAHQSLLAGEALREALRAAAGDAERDLDLLPATGLRERLAGERLRLTGLRLLREKTRKARGTGEAGQLHRRGE